MGVEFTTFLWTSKLAWLRLLWIFEPLSPSLRSVGILCIRNSPSSMKYTCVVLIVWLPDTVQVCKAIAPPISTGWRTIHNFCLCMIQRENQSTFYTQFSVKSQNTVILTVKWTRYFWARSYSGWVLSSYFFKTMLNWFKSRILSLLMQREPIFSYK